MEEGQAPRLCLYCGADNSAGKKECYLCHHALPSAEELSQAKDDLLPVPQPPDISRFRLEFEEDNGFSHPDWKSVSKQIDESIPKAEWWDVCHKLSKQWLSRLKADLGGNYRCYESKNFLCLCAEGAEATRTMLDYAEGSLEFLGKHFGTLLPKESYGKRVLLIFTDQDDYYAYISHFHTEGAHSLSSGMMLHRGYAHIAFPFTWVFSAKSIITHELVHNCIAHLRIPVWLHEGLA